MNYSNLYKSIIENRKFNCLEGYKEIHHILPKSLGGVDTEDNLVNLSAREHFICHLLLTKMYPEGSIEWIKMMKAFMCMMFRRSDNQQRYLNSRWYSYYKENFSKVQSKSQSGKGNSQYRKCWIYNENLKQSKSIKIKELKDYLNRGWLKGRVSNWEKFELQKEGYNKTYTVDKIKKLKKNKVQKEKQKEQNLKIYRYYYDLYNKYGWEKFKQITHYPYSKQNLVMLLQRNLPEFKPQNGKKRGK